MRQDLGHELLDSRLVFLHLTLRTSGAATVGVVAVGTPQKFRLGSCSTLATFWSIPGDL